MQFSYWCATEGWKFESTKGEYEVLRMSNPKFKHPLIVHEKAKAKEHYTTHGVSQRMAIKFYEKVKL